MYALKLYIKFPFALFNLHYTKSCRLSYPIPLPTTIKGIFENMLGLNRNESLNGYMFGAKIITYKSSFYEYSSLKQIGKNIMTVIRSQVLGDVDYFLYIANKDLDILKNIENRLKNPMRVPYGGISDFISEFWKVEGIIKCQDTYTFYNTYVPEPEVKEIFLEENGEVYKLPVMNENVKYVFVINGKIVTNNPKLGVEGAMLY
jgi:CRISPR-associated Cas5-like protein